MVAVEEDEKERKILENEDFPGNVNDVHLTSNIQVQDTRDSVRHQSG